MKAVRLHKFHSAPVIDEVPDPVISHPLDVIVRIGGAGVCRTDLHIIEGQWDSRMGTPLPYILGHENAGWVSEVGSAVTNVAVGDTVILHPTPTCGLGHIGVQCLAALSATRIIVVDRNPDALKLAGQLGAGHTVVADGTHVDAVKDLTGGNGAHVVLDFVAEQGAEMDAWDMTAPGGSDFVIGYGGTITIPTLDIISTERNIIGNIVGTYNELAELMALAQAGKVTLHTRPYPLTAAPDALADLDAGRVRGRAILVP